MYIKAVETTCEKKFAIYFYRKTEALPRIFTEQIQLNPCCESLWRSVKSTGRNIFAMGVAAMKSISYCKLKEID